MRKYTKLNPTFKKEIMITETGDPGHADNINAGPIQIFENTIANKEEIEKGDSKDRTVTFMSNDSADALSWTDVALMKSGEKHKNLFEKISTMFKNVRFLYRLLGQTDISTIKDGTVTGILNELKQVAFTGIYSDLNNKPLALPASDVYTWAKQAAKPAYSKSEVGLGNVNNTSDKDKPVSTEQQTALDKKVNFADISRSAAVNVAGKKALDAMEKNALIEGTLAHDISQIYSNIQSANDELSQKSTSIINSINYMSDLKRTYQLKPNKAYLVTVFAYSFDNADAIMNTGAFFVYTPYSNGANGAIREIYDSGHVTLSVDSNCLLSIEGTYRYMHYSITQL